MFVNKLRKIKTIGADWILLYFIGVFVFCCINLVYHFNVVIPALGKYTENNSFSHIANIHDHFEYYFALTGILNDSDGTLSILNVGGISSFYGYIQGYIKNLDILTIAQIFNISSIVIASYLHLKICKEISLCKKSLFIFFLNFPLIYFGQLIGKDSIYTMILYCLCYFFLTKRHLWLILIGFVGASIRIQTPLLACLLLFYNLFSFTNKKKLIIIYIMTSIAGALIFARSIVLGQDADHGDGLTSLVFYMNINYYLGNLLLNPIRIIQYIYEYVSYSVSYLFEPWNYFKLFILPMFFYLTFNLKWSLLTLMNSKNKLGVFFVINVFFVLMIPIINLRYFLVILPFLALGVSKEKNEKNSRALHRR